ncbi:MAG TPA: hypothetical protein PLV82_04425, partial [bacterium]|nr:hypothetical protein [bacterium]
FEVINIDPPWAYGTKFDPNGRRVANPYPEMSQEELIYEEHTKIIYFPLKHMIKISDLTDEQIKNIRKFHSGKYDYNKY